MHAVSKPFNAWPENAPLADDYAIVMGSSHAEPMLRNNVGEWPHDRDKDYNYLTNRDGVLKYWEERVAANGRYENIYTLGMRGIHDSSMQGPKTNPERIATLEKIFADQRALIAKHVRPEIERVPQIFCAYKEVLPLYRGGLQVPDDVTVMFPDDNFGYIRDFPLAAERNRAGGFGVYYHLSYLGAPLSYLWLSTTPPALIWEEMTKAYDHGARTIWIANVGDLKPAEIGTEFFLQMAWDIHRWNRDNLRDFLPQWAEREFGGDHAQEIGGIMADYYRLNFQRRPEHLQWWMPKEAPRASALSDAEVQARLDEFNGLAKRVVKAAHQITSAQDNAFFELISYPVFGARLANERFFLGERGGDAIAEAMSADRQLREDLTIHFNDEIADGKWRGVMALEPADNDWKSMRIAKWEVPKYSRPPAVAAGAGGFIALEVEHFTRKADRDGAGWAVVLGLGRTGEGAVAVFPTTASSVESDRIATTASHLDYDVTFGAAGNFPLTAYLVPAHPISGSALRFAIALDDALPQIVALEFKDGAAEWAQGVVDNTRTVTTTLRVPTPGAHTLKIFMVDAGVVLDKIVVDCGGLTPSYLGPTESHRSAP